MVPDPPRDIDPRLAGADLSIGSVLDWVSAHLRAVADLLSPIHPAILDEYAMGRGERRIAKVAAAHGQPLLKRKAAPAAAERRTRARVNQEDDHLYLCDICKTRPTARQDGWCRACRDDDVFTEHQWVTCIHCKARTWQSPSEMRTYREHCSRACMMREDNPHSHACARCDRKLLLDGVVYRDDLCPLCKRNDREGTNL